MRVGLAIAVAAVLAGTSPASAQGLEEIVVTAERAESFDATETPHVILKKRADNLIVKVTVVCDTRDESQRRAELKSTLRNLIRAAQADASIELGVGDEIVGGFNETMLDAAIRPDAKADTSRATLLIKTAVKSIDTFDEATARIVAFVEKTPKVGRTEVLLDDEWQLTLIGPEQYRAEITKLVAVDARKVAEIFGANYGAEVANLQLPVSWYQSGPLDLALYIPYRQIIRPIQP